MNELFSQVFCFLRWLIHSLTCLRWWVRALLLYLRGYPLFFIYFKFSFVEQWLKRGFPMVYSWLAVFLLSETVTAVKVQELRSTSKTGGCGLRPWNTGSPVSQRTHTNLLFFWLVNEQQRTIQFWSSDIAISCYDWDLHMAYFNSIWCWFNLLVY